jgi:hypothetical protein
MAINSAIISFLTIVLSAGNAIHVKMIGKNRIERNYCRFLYNHGIERFET